MSETSDDEIDETSPVLASPESSQIKGSRLEVQSKIYSGNSGSSIDCQKSTSNMTEKNSYSEKDSFNSILENNIDKSASVDEIQIVDNRCAEESLSDKTSFDYIDGVVGQSRDKLDDQSDSMSKKDFEKMSKWSGFKKKTEKLFYPCLSKNLKLPENPSKWDLLRSNFLLPPHGIVAQLIFAIICILTLWLAFMAMFGEIAVPPKGTHFLLIVLVVVAMVAGKLFSLIKLPALLGMLITGIAMKSIPGIEFDTHWTSYSATLRGIALVVILMRAGLGLDPVALKKLSGMVFRLAFTPCLVEAVTVAIASHFLLDLPWLWGFMLGFVLAAVSPAVVVPSLLALQEQGYGVDKGIPTLVIAASSVDDVLAISAFTIILGITFKPNADILAVAFQGPIEAIVGLVFGIFWGVLAIFFPGFDSTLKDFGRLFVLLGGSLLAMFGSSCQGVDLPGAGALAVLVMSFVAGLGWRRQGWEDDNPVSSNLATLWIILQPLLFGLIGTEIQISELDGSTVGMGILVLFIGLTLRVGASFASVSLGDLTLKERLFVSLAWLPKATVQAAIGSLALDNSKALPEEREDKFSMITNGEKVLTIAVLSILITAPIGAIAIRLTAGKLLPKTSKDTDDSSKPKEV